MSHLDNWGIYTPTLTNVTNVDSSTAFKFQWLRVGNTVTVSGKVEIDPANVGMALEIGVSLPVPSNFIAEEDCGGTATDISSSQGSMGVLADVANGRAKIVGVPATNSNETYPVMFTYEVLS